MDLLAAGLRINAPRVAGERGQPVVSRASGPVHRLPAGAGEQGHGDAGERALAARVVKLERALAVAEMRAEGAERLAAERAARIEDLRVSLGMRGRDASAFCQAVAAPMVVAVGRGAPRCAVLVLQITIHGTSSSRGRRIAVLRPPGLYLSAGIGSLDLGCLSDYRQRLERRS